MSKDWSLTSWTSYKYQQCATYEDEALLNKVVQELSCLPPLVTSGEVKHLKRLIAQAGRGEAFILQGGDCAESFKDCQSDRISNKLKIMLQMSLILIHSMRKPVIRIGRIAGQYAKPRSSNLETIGDLSLPSYRGDLINAPEFTEEGRRANPKRLLKGYSTSAITLNFIRSLLNGGFANLQHPHQWDLSFVQHSRQSDEYHKVVNSIADSLDFLKSINGLQNSSIDRVDFFTSHEALHLHYEQALTRQVKDGLWYNLSTHLPWIGMRTAQTDSAHLEFLRGVQNPVGIKVGPKADKQWLREVLERINPDQEEGRVLLITRFGADKVRDLLAPMIETVQSLKTPVTWCCDPMHGNTETTTDGIKTRHFDNILSELRDALAIHKQMNSYLGGVHFELTGDNVTECIGGARGLSSSDLKNAYHTLVDPRLNYEQSLEMAIQLGKEFS